MPDPSSPSIRVSAKTRDIDYWRCRFKSVPTISLDGAVITAPIVEARSGEYGYVVTELCDTTGKPVLANVVLPDGRVVDRVIPTETRHGVVSIQGEQRAPRPSKVAV